MMILALAVGFGLFLAYANGANDNFKGVATIYGSRTTGYRQALGWATLMTALGSLTALVLAQGLLAKFSGKGLVPDAVAASSSFALAVGAAAAATVMLATRLGFPISTTHALTGALVGAGWLASPVGVDLAKLGNGFFAPLLASPVMALGLAVVAYPLFRFARVRLGVRKDLCVCVGECVVGVVPAGVSREQALAAVALPEVSVGTVPVCVERYDGRVLGVSAGSVLDSLHFLSAGAVSFARGLNDTPKVAAAMLVGGAFSPTAGVVAAAVAIALGGVLSGRQVAETLALKVTDMNAGQGFSANLVTAFLVTVASRYGLPVSTTHVSGGAIFGIGAITRQARWKIIGQILLAWVTTLPIAALLGGGFYLLLRSFLG